jgi:predicted PurR-regulated permease PerM
VSIRSIALSGLFVLAILACLYAARVVLIPVALAAILAMVLAPVVKGMHRWARIPAPLGSAMLLLAVAALVTSVAWMLSGEAGTLLRGLPEDLERLETKFRGVSEGMEELREAEEQVEELTANGEGDAVAVRVERPTLSEFLFGQTWYIVTNSFLTLGLLYFLLASGDLFLQKLVRVMPRLEDKKTALTIVRDVHHDLAWYFLDITLINIGLGVAVGLAMWALGMPNPLLWGVMATLLNFVPFAGAIVGVIVVGLASATVFDDVWRALLVPVVYYALTALEGSFLTPTILGRKLVLNPVVIFVALIFWGWMWGIPGIFLAVPIMSAVKIASDHASPRTRVVGEFLGR